LLDVIDENIEFRYGKMVTPSSESGSEGKTDENRRFPKYPEKGVCKFKISAHMILLAGGVVDFRRLRADQDEDIGQVTPIHHTLFLISGARLASERDLGCSHCSGTVYLDRLRLYLSFLLTGTGRQGRLGGDLRRNRLLKFKIVIKKDKSSGIIRAVRSKSTTHADAKVKDCSPLFKRHRFAHTILCSQTVERVSAILFSRAGALTDQRCLLWSMVWHNV
jgi:hypothetical protein